MQSWFGVDGEHKQNSQLTPKYNKTEHSLAQPELAAQCKAVSPR